jgi:hypothetical protein
MIKEVVSSEIARSLKELGFNELCIFMYDKLDMFSTNLDKQKIFSGINYNSSEMTCSAPFYQQVLDWFREKYFLHLRISSMMDHDLLGTNMYDFDITNVLNASFTESPIEFKTYEEARDQAILETIKIIKMSKEIKM